MRCAGHVARMGEEGKFIHFCLKSWRKESTWDISACMGR